MIDVDVYITEMIDADVYNHSFFDIKEPLSRQTNNHLVFTSKSMIDSGHHGSLPAIKKSIKSLFLISRLR